MDNIRNSFSFIVVGKTKESTEGGEFKRYIGLGSSFVKAINPDKKQLDEIMGFESAAEPEYVVDTDEGKEARVTFIVATDPAVNNGIELKVRAMFTLRNTPDYNKDKTKVRVIDGFGNYNWADVSAAKAGAKLFSSEGKELKIDTKYRMACVGECALVSFLKAYLNIGDAFSYVNGSWVKKSNAEDFAFALENIKDYFKGDFSEIREAIALQPNNKVKLLYGVRTNDEGKQFQTVATRPELILRNSANEKAVTRLAKDLANAKSNGAYASTEFRVCELQEWNVTPTNLEQPVESNDNDMPWD